MGGGGGKGGGGGGSAKPMPGAQFQPYTYRSIAGSTQLKQNGLGYNFHNSLILRYKNYIAQGSHKHNLY